MKRLHHRSFQLLRGIGLAAVLLAGGCALDATPEHVGSTGDALTVGGVGGCDTGVLDALSKQLIAEQNCLQPGSLVSFSGAPGISVASGVYPFLEPAAAAGLEQAAAQTPLKVTSAFRTLGEQYLLYRYYQQHICDITLAASPGASNHETGTAVDLGNYGAAYSAMTSHGFTHSYPTSDPVHYDYTAGSTVDLRTDSVLAFQKLWNVNNPNDPIAEDGAYGPSTEARLVQSPAGGFAIGSTCGADAWPLQVHRSAVDVDGDGKADVCARAGSGIVCGLSSGGPFAKAITGPAWSDATGWTNPIYDATIQLGDVNGDGKADVCARAAAGIVCNFSTGDGFGPDVNGPAWSDASSWKSPQYYTTIQLADVDGDRKADLCGRSSVGIVCELGGSTGFTAEIIGPAWSDASGWADVKYYSTIQLADVNGDGKADVCARAASGIVCELSDGHGFPTEIQGPAWSDASGWGAVQYGSTIRFVDIDGDGKADVCGRSSAGIVCSLSDGNGFGAPVPGPAWSDAEGWAKPEYFSTIQFADINGDRKTDVCARAGAGMTCTLSNGASFATEVTGPTWSDASGWNKPEYYTTIGAADVNGDGKADLCGRDAMGITCALSTGTGFGPTFNGPAWSDAADWAKPTYYSTIRFVGGALPAGADPTTPPQDSDGGTDPTGDPNDPARSGGCGCAVAGGSSSTSAAGLAALMALVAVALGRVRRARRRSA